MIQNLTVLAPRIERGTEPDGYPRTRPTAADIVDPEAGQPGSECEQDERRDEAPLLESML